MPIRESSATILVMANYLIGTIYTTTSSTWFITERVKTSLGLSFLSYKKRVLSDSRSTGTYSSRMASRKTL